jgi:hypothetical protein
MTRVTRTRLVDGAARRGAEINRVMDACARIGGSNVGRVGTTGLPLQHHCKPDKSALVGASE